MTLTDEEIETLADGYPWPSARTRRAIQMSERAGMPFAGIVAGLDALAETAGVDADPVEVVAGGAPGVPGHEAAAMSNLGDDVLDIDIDRHRSLLVARSNDGATCVLCVADPYAIAVVELTPSEALRLSDALREAVT